MADLTRDKDATDAEFAEVDCDGTALPSSPERPRKPDRPWGYVLVVAAMIVGSAIYYFAERPKKSGGEMIASWPVGWAQLIDCYSVISLDGKRELHFSDENQRAVLYDLPATRDSHPVAGNWKFDQAANRYVIDIGGTTTTYFLMEPRGAACMLVKGNPSAADLNESWFADMSESDDSVDHDYQLSPREP